MADIINIDFTYAGICCIISKERVKGQFTDRPFTLVPDTHRKTSIKEEREYGKSSSRC